MYIQVEARLFVRFIVTKAEKLIESLSVFHTVVQILVQKII